MDTTQRAGQAADCPLCGGLPDELIVRTGRDESFPAAFKKLVYVSGEITSWGNTSQDYRCPDCGAKFICEDDNAFTGSGINDESRIIRVQAKAPVRHAEAPAKQAGAPVRRPVTSWSDDHAAYLATREAEAEAAYARRAFSIMEKHFASAGAVMKNDVPPNDWSGFCTLFYRNTIGFVQRGSHPRLLAGLLADLVGLMYASSGRSVVNDLYRLLVDFRHYSWLEPLLPDAARNRIGDFEEMLSEAKDADERFRLGQMSY